MIRLPRLVVPASLFLLLLALVYFDPLFLRRNFAGRDLIGYHLPIEKVVHDAYARGRLPVWIQEISGGRPLLANINVGALYPVRPLLSLVPFPVAMRMFPVLHWAIAGFGIMALLSKIEASPCAQWVGAVTYVFSGVGVSEMFFPNIQPGMSLLPWIVWSVTGLRSQRVSRVFVVSLLLGLDLLAGDVFTVALALAASLLWIWLEEDRPARGPALAAFGLSLLLSLLLAFPQLVATLLWIPETRRAVTGMTIAGALRFSLSPWRLLEFIIPYPFGPTWEDEARAWAPAAFGGLPMGFFSTLYVGMFAAVATVHCWKGRERGSRFARGLALFGLAVCVLPSFVPDAWTAWKSPLPLRYPEKFVVALMLSAAVFAGIGFDRFRARAEAVRWPLVVGAILALAAGVAALWPHAAGQVAAFLVSSKTSSAQAASAYLPGALAEGGLLWIGGVLALKCLLQPSRAALAAALVLTTGAPIAANRWIAHSFLEEDVFAPPAFVRAMDRKDPGRDFRTMSESRYIPPSQFEGAQLSSDVGFLDYRRRSWLYYTSALWKRGVVFNDDYDAGDLSRLASLRLLSGSASRFAPPEGFFESLSLRFGNRFPDQPAPPGFHRFGGNSFEVWDENPKALPDVRLLTAWREEPGPLQSLSALSTLQFGQVTLETGAEGLRSAGSGSLRILEKSPENLRVETDSRDPTYLFVLRGFWPYRSVTIDGVSALVVPAQLAFSAVAVPTGRHQLEWKERVPGASFSRWSPVLWAAVLCLAALRERRRRPAGR